LQISEGKQPRIVDPFSRAEKSRSAAALLAASNTIVQPSFAGCCMDFKRSCHCHAGRYISRRGSTWSDPRTAPDLTSWIMASFKLNEPQFDCHPVPHTAQESSSAPRPSNSSQRLTGALSHGAFSRFESPIYGPPPVLPPSPMSHKQQSYLVSLLFIGHVKHLPSPSYHCLSPSRSSSSTHL
jgi:hypothetical protein